MIECIDWVKVTGALSFPLVVIGGLSGCLSSMAVFEAFTCNKSCLFKCVSCVVFSLALMTLLLGSARGTAWVFLTATTC